MRNPFSDVVKLIKASEHIFLQRVGDMIYMCDGHYIFKVNETVYRAYFRTECACFTELEDAAMMTAENAKSLPECGGVDIHKYYTKAISDSIPIPVTISNFLYEIPADNSWSKSKPRILRIAGNDKFTVTLNENFMKAAKNIYDYIGGSSYYGTGSKQPIYFNSDEAGALILPVNSEIANKDFNTCFRTA